MALLFKSTGVAGHLPVVENDAARIVARKREREVRVRFASTAGTVQSPEGLVHVKAGDAILTGSGGENWRVSRARFSEKYAPQTGTVAGQDGVYISKPNRVLALQPRQDFEVVLSDGQSRLQGHRGDWLVDYGDGSLGVVAESIFPATYEIVS